MKMAGVRREEGGMEERDGKLALLALVGVLAVTVVWWALALWPVPGETPAWLDRARLVCFNAGPDGMPDASGWLLLIGQPLGMFGFLVVVWPRPLARGLRWAGGNPGGRVGLSLALLVVVGGLAGTSVRVANAAQARFPLLSLPVQMSAAEHPRLDREPAELGLLDQRGRRVTLEDLQGVPGVVTFAFGNCHDICPLVVQHARDARDQALGPEGGFLVVVTLDPWRDTPSRLESLARRWSLEGERDHLLSGTVEEVEAVLDAWNVARSRDVTTGDVAHPPLFYLLDGEGRVAHITMSGREVIAELAAGL